MPNPRRSRPRLLLLSMYPLDRGSWGPTVRIRHLRDELAARADLDVVAGYRGSRRLALGRYAVSGRLRGLNGIYVESSSFLPAEADIAFVALARSLGIPVLTYVRDAYQLFPDEYPVRGWRARLGASLFRAALRALRTVSTRLAFPTLGLARAVLGHDADGAALLPPGSPPPVSVPRDPAAHRLLFVGDARLPAHGADRLLAAVARVRASGTEAALTIVCRPGQEPPGDLPEWAEVRRAEGAAIHDLLGDVVACVIPRPPTPYNDLALPIKLFDYLSYGRPLLVTDCVEQARIVREADAGVVVGDTVKALADGIGRILTASPEDLDRWSAAGHRAAEASTWGARADQIIALLQAASDSPS